jgi:hypothetical protein
MPLRRLAAVIAIIVCATIVSAKDKKKVLLPADVLRARNVLVIIDPSAGVDATDPLANRKARENVEAALDKWGRFDRVQQTQTADLIIVVRKGNGKLIQPTIGGTPINSTPPVSGSQTSSPGQTTTRGAVRWGTGVPGDPSNAGAGPASPTPQIEAGATEDTFAVYRGSMDDPNWSPLDAPPVWRYSHKDALEAPEVPAVEAFRKLVAESEKQLASQP